MTTTDTQSNAKIEERQNKKSVVKRDESGGSGANFIVEWSSETPVNPPIIESVMIGAQSSQGISFTSRGREILPPEQ